MQPIADWLEKLGLGQYEQCFVENAVDLGVLRDLTDQDLEKLGVLLGHRRKLLRAIAEMNSGDRGEPKPAATAPVAPTTPPSAVRLR